ncbi:MAG: PAS domain-containing sensor histidine kinase, partial [Chitinophagaceae bacterium]
AAALNASIHSKQKTELHKVLYHFNLGKPEEQVVDITNIAVDATETTPAHVLHFADRPRKQLASQKSHISSFETLFKNIQDYSIYFLSTDGIITSWNKGAERIKGYSASDAIGKNFSMFYPEEDKKGGLPQKLLSQARETGKATHEGWRVRKDGSKFWGSVLITAIHDASDDVIGFTKVTRDLTERKKAEDDFAKYTAEVERKNAELESINNELKAFAYVSSHDLQEPLRKIQTFSDKILEKEFDHLSTQGQDYFLRMKNAARRMQALIEDLLTYAQTNITERKLERVDLNELIKEVKTDLKEMVESKNALIETEGLGELNVIPFQFKQLMQNLLSNAIKFSKPGEQPVINVSSENGKGKDFRLPELDTDTDYVRIEVRDNGIGFDPEYSNKIFELFQRLHGKHEYPGTGIGLSICKRIVENHDGIIRSESKPGGGAAFQIYLPELN